MMISEAKVDAMMAGLKQENNALHKRAEKAEASATLYRMRIEQLEAALRPFAKAGHIVRKVNDGDLWVSIGVASSAWITAREAVPVQSDAEGSPR